MPASSSTRSRSHRSLALGRRGMVAAAHPYAVVAGLDVLKAGGTAADAAVATNAVLGVTEPQDCGVGGDFFCLYYEAATGRVHFLNGAGRSGSRAGLDELRRRGMDRLPVIGPPTVSVPGCVRAWGMLLERFGTRPLGELLQPAIHYAAHGFPVSSFVSQVIREYASVTPDAEWRRVFTPGGRGPEHGGGLVALLGLNVLQGFDLRDYPLHSAEHLHLLIEIVKLAYADRDRWIGDPDHAPVPLAGLLSRAYAARRRHEFDPEKAKPHTFGDPQGDTTGFVIADQQGNLISVVESLFNAFGSGVVAPGTGVVLHNRGRHFTVDPTHPSVFAPRKRPFHTLMAAIATRDDRPVLGFSTMGGNGQAMFHIQVLSNLLDYGLDMQEAIERPRFLIGAFLPGDPDDTTHVESRLGPDVLAALEAKGHRVKPAPDLFWRCGQAHGIALRAGTMMGGADPRGDGVALG